MANRRRLWAAYSIVCIVVCIWVGVVFAVPILAGGTDSAGRAAEYLTLLYAPVCHQIPERCFFIDGHPLPVCSRCTGLYIGFFLGMVFSPLLRGKRRRRVPDRKVLIVAAAPLILEVILSKAGIFDGGLWVRFLSALPAALAASSLVFPALSELIEKSRGDL